MSGDKKMQSYKPDVWMLRKALEKEKEGTPLVYALVHKPTGMFFRKTMKGIELARYPEFRLRPTSFNYWLRRFQYPEEFAVIAIKISAFDFQENFF
jgi:hypothetical protein